MVPMTPKNVRPKPINPTTATSTTVVQASTVKVAGFRHSAYPPPRETYAVATESIDTPTASSTTDSHSLGALATFTDLAFPAVSRGEPRKGQHPLIVPRYVYQTLQVTLILTCKTRKNNCLVRKPTSGTSFVPRFEAGVHRVERDTRSKAIRELF